MHSVSQPFMVEAFRRFSFEPFMPVATAARLVPTVKFPNPEEHGERARPNASGLPLESYL